MKTEASPQDCDIRVRYLDILREKFGCRGPGQKQGKPIPFNACPLEAHFFRVGQPPNGLHNSPKSIIIWGSSVQACGPVGVRSPNNQTIKPYFLACEANRRTMSYCEQVDISLVLPPKRMREQTLPVTTAWNHSSK